MLESKLQNFLFLHFSYDSEHKFCLPFNMFHKGFFIFNKSVATYAASALEVIQKLLFSEMFNNKNKYNIITSSIYSETQRKYFKFIIYWRRKKLK